MLDAPGNVDGWSTLLNNGDNPCVIKNNDQPMSAIDHMSILPTANVNNTNIITTYTICELSTDESHGNVSSAE